MKDAEGAQGTAQNYPLSGRSVSARTQAVSSQLDRKRFAAGEWSVLGSRDMDCIGRMVMRPRERGRTSHYNLYRYCHNDPINKTDPFGLADKVYPGGESDWATNYNPTDRIVMVAHGNPGQGAVDTVNNKIISPSTIAKDAIAAGYSESKNKVELSICGSGVGGKDSLAQKVANELAARTGVKPDVGAPDGNTANPSYKNDSTGAIRSGPLTGAPDPKTKGDIGRD